MTKQDRSSGGMEWIKMRLTWLRGCRMLSDTEAGRLLKSISAFVLDGAEPDGTGKEGLLTAMVLDQLKTDLTEYRSQRDAQQKKTEEITEKRRKAAAARWAQCKPMQMHANASTCMQVHDLHGFASQEEETEKEKECKRGDTIPTRTREPAEERPYTTVHDCTRLYTSTREPAKECTGDYCEIPQSGREADKTDLPMRGGDLLTDEEIVRMQHINTQIMPGIEQVCRSCGMGFSVFDAAQVRELLEMYKPDQITKAVVDVKRSRGWVTWERVNDYLGGTTNARDYLRRFDASGGVAQGRADRRGLDDGQEASTEIRLS